MICQVDQDVEISLHVQPKARRPGITGVHDNRLRVAVSAPPEKGRANRAVVELIAKTVGVAAGRVEIIRGNSSRSKQIRITGVTLDEVSSKLLP